jgi:hypothetical protein
MDNSLVFLALILVAFVFVMNSNKVDDENFISNSYNRNAAPYYTTTFQAYPGKYMRYASNRNSFCLQQHQEYAGYRNCMLYLE